MRWCFLSSQTLFESTMELIKIDLFPSCHSVVLRPCNHLPFPKHSRVLISQAFPSPKRQSCVISILFIRKSRKWARPMVRIMQAVSDKFKKKFRCPDYSVLRSGHMRQGQKNPPPPPRPPRTELRLSRRRGDSCTVFSMNLRGSEICAWLCRLRNCLYIDLYSKASR